MGWDGRGWDRIARDGFPLWIPLWIPPWIPPWIPLWTPRWIPLWIPLWIALRIPDRIPVRIPRSSRMIMGHERPHAGRNGRAAGADSASGGELCAAGINRQHSAQMLALFVAVLVCCCAGLVCSQVRSLVLESVRSWHGGVP